MRIEKKKETTILKTEVFCGKIICDGAVDDDDDEKAVQFDQKLQVDLIRTTSDFRQLTI